MDNRFNTIAGWVLGAGIVALGATLVTGEMFKAHRPAVMGFPIEGVETEAEAEAEQPIAFFLHQGDAARGEQAFRKCAACHSIEPGAAHGLGPNLFGNIGQSIASEAGFNFSEALRARSGERWTWENLSEFLRSPRAFAPGTRMTFAGLGNPQERADLMLFMNSRTPSPIPLPPPPAPAGPEEEMSPEQQAAEEAMEGAEGDMGHPQPILTQEDLARQPEGQRGGPAAGTGRDPRR